MLRCAKFGRNRSKCGGDMTIFLFFQDGGGRHLGFTKFQTFNGQAAQEVELRRHAKFGRMGQNAAEI